MPRGIPYKTDEERMAGLVARKAYQKRWRDANKQRHREMIKAWHVANKDRFTATTKAWRRANPDKVKAQQHRQDAKPHRKAQRGDARARQVRYQERNQERVRARRREFQARRRMNPAERAVDAIRRRLRHVCNGNARGTFKILGYSADQLRRHLEVRFKPGMNWENYGEWHVDHRRPVSSFKLPEQIEECFALSNLQPLWAVENLAKSNKQQILEAA